MDQLGCKRYCCRRMIMTHVDLIEKLLRWVLDLRLSSWMRRRTHWDYPDTIPLRGTEPKPKYNRSGTRYNYELYLTQSSTMQMYFFGVCAEMYASATYIGRRGFRTDSTMRLQVVPWPWNTSRIGTTVLFCAAHVYLYCSCCTRPMTNQCLLCFLPTRANAAWSAAGGSSQRDYTAALLK